MMLLILKNIPQINIKLLICRNLGEKKYAKDKNLTQRISRFISYQQSYFEGDPQPKADMSMASPSSGKYIRKHFVVLESLKL